MRPKIYTIGYASTTPEELELLIDQLGAVLIDVRLHPSSRYPEWTEGRLRKRFGKRYVHIPELGNINYKNKWPVVLANPGQGIERLADVIDHHPIVLLCTCYNHAQCHRKQAAEILAWVFEADVTPLYGQAQLAI